MSSSQTPFLRLEKVSKSYQSGPKRLVVLNQFDMVLREGELLALMGASGSGKTTLLHLIAGLDQVDSGRIHLGEQELTSLKSKGWDEVRQRAMGYVFQFNQLLPEFTALENIMLPGLVANHSEPETRKRAQNLLDRMALLERADHLPSQLSGGEQQRIAIARALINRPKLLLADEPTGSLDVEAGRRVFDLLSELQRDLKISCLVVTHNPVLANLCARIHSLNREDSC